MTPNGTNRPSFVLDEALRRRATGAPPDVTAYRVLNGPADGAPAGLTLDRYGAYLVMSARAHLPRDLVLEWAEAARARLEPEGVVLKWLAPRVADSRSERLFGEVPEARIEVREGQARLLCALDDGVQTGLFLDHRETRWLAREHAAGVEVLNLFAYTCAFSVHAAQAGATRVTSVDASRKALDWGRDNMRASGCDPDRHRWFTDDVVRHVGRGQGGQYGLIILDPPVFGRAKGRSFSLKNDLGALLEGSIRKLAPRGVLIFSTHHQELEEAELLGAVQAAAARVGGRVRLEEQRGLPSWDHPVDPAARGADALDRGNYLKTLVLRMEGK